MTTFQTDLNSKKRGIDSLSKDEKLELRRYLVSHPLEELEDIAWKFNLSVMGLMLFTYREIEKGA